MSLELLGLLLELLLLLFTQKLQKKSRLQREALQFVFFFFVIFG